MIKRLKMATIAVLIFAMAMPVSALGSVQVASMKEQAEAPGMHFSASYPRLSGIGNQERQQILNRTFHEASLSVKTQAEYAAKQAPILAQFGYQVTRNEKGVLSICNERTLQQNGHDRREKQGIRVNTANGAPYSFSSLFKKNTDYVGVLSERVQAQIASKGFKGKQKKPFKQIGLQQDFYLTKTDLVLIIPQGTYFSDDCGIVEFKIALQSLDGVLNPSIRF
ncbi:MAG TPA: hypothetical protein DEP42_06540 [Ruminococcaceae bacterium]|nr:hypothetical protein [Oscillospiraceae bacterium]